MSRATYHFGPFSIESEARVLFEMANGCRFLPRLPVSNLLAAILQFFGLGTDEGEAFQEVLG